MKSKRVYYNDDGILLPGILITRFFRKPVFYPMDTGCGFDAQVIYREHQNRITPYPGGTENA